MLIYTLQILDKEAVEEVRGQREIPDIKPGYIIQLKVVRQVPSTSFWKVFVINISIIILAVYGIIFVMIHPVTGNT